jgi:hypothetical protein
MCSVDKGLDSKHIDTKFLKKKSKNSHSNWSGHIEMTSCRTMSQKELKKVKIQDFMDKINLF